MHRHLELPTMQLLSLLCSEYSDTLSLCPFLLRPYKKKQGAFADYLSVLR